jgi:hypothetical protein
MHKILTTWLGPLQKRLAHLWSEGKAIFSREGLWVLEWLLGMVRRRKRWFQAQGRARARAQ